ncbi:MAG: calcium/sodium antiporter [Bacteriovoracaceae bacterium]|nr:calcium/sodium antiporter [Bacteriovoracaceae bacterium]
MLTQALWFQVILMTASLGILYIGADLALASAEKIGKAIGISSLVVGLLIVGFGTSLPEFFVSHLACIHEKPGIALGNIIGSNVANLFLIMAIAGILVRLTFSTRDIIKQLILHLVITILVFVIFKWINILHWASFFILCGFFAWYLYFTFKKMEKHIHDENEPKPKLNFIDIGKLLVGFILLYVGGELLVYSGSSLGKILGVSTFVISAIFVAFGTSFPELMTVLVACIKKKDVNLITGNIIGSNIFNVGFVMGSISIYKVKLTETFYYEMAVLFFACFFLLLLAFMKKKFHRWSGVGFLLIYIGMVCYWVCCRG